MDAECKLITKSDEEYLIERGERMSIPGYMQRCLVMYLAEYSDDYNYYSTITSHVPTILCQREIKQANYAGWYDRWLER